MYITSICIIYIYIFPSPCYVPTPRAIILDGGKVPYSHYKREFDLINNRYIKNHEERLEKDAAILREEAQMRYWRTHDYNPIEGTYYNLGKEHAFQQKRKEQEKVCVCICLCLSDCLPALCMCVCVWCVYICLCACPSVCSVCLSVCPSV